MKTIGFVKSTKENEKRIALLPNDLKPQKNTSYIYIEKGYGKDLHIEDDAYRSLGCNIVDRTTALQQDIICDVKVGEADYLRTLENHQSIFGWVHLIGNLENLKHMNKTIKMYAWEKMKKDNRYCFYKNSELAGEAAIQNAFHILNKTAKNKKVAVLGRGSVAKGAIKILNIEKADVSIYNRHQETLFRKEANMFDVIVNAVLWDKNRKDHILYTSDLALLKKDALIIDISCDEAGAIESSKPTTIKDPVYKINGIIHYAVDNTPSLVYKEASNVISHVVSEYLDDLIEEKNNSVIEKSKVDWGSL